MRGPPQRSAAWHFSAPSGSAGLTAHILLAVYHRIVRLPKLRSIIPSAKNRKPLVIRYDQVEFRILNVICQARIDPQVDDVLRLFSRCHGADWKLTRGVPR